MKTKTLIIMGLVFLLLVAGMFTVSQLMAGEIIQTPTFQILSNLLTLGLVFQSAIFSFVLYRQAKSTDARAEAFRNLQFIASNHTIIEFFDNMLIFRESERYVKRLKETMDFKFYMRENGIDFEDVKANIDKYHFLTVKIPLRVIVGNAISSVQFKNFRLDRTDKTHSFVPCSDNFYGLILYNDDEKRQEVSVNLIVNKDSEFYIHEIINPFTKIKIFLTMHSFLGVEVSGWTELYFTNPQKLDKDGANRYKITSSQFQISGLPKLKDVVMV